MTHEGMTTLMSVVALTWTFMVGAAVGSFLNVVVHRLPLGLSLTRPGSRCPRCLAPIRAQDNLPILGWLLLRGRCRDCDAPISVRYPLVELAVATIFLFSALGVIWMQVGRGGRMSLSRATLEMQWPVIALWLAFSIQATILLADALIRFDGERPPPIAFWLWTLLASLTGLVANFLGAVQLGTAPAASDIAWMFSRGALTWLLTGAFLGAVANRASRDPRESPWSLGFRTMLGPCAFLGNGAFLVAGAAVLFSAATRSRGRMRIDATLVATALVAFLAAAAGGVLFFRH